MDSPVKAEFRRCAVLGAGTMGAGIAAQIANAGVPVLLYDISRAVAEAALARLARTEPPAFMEPAAQKLVTPRGIDSDLAELGTCDWIVEAIVEKFEAKRALYASVAVHAGPAAIVSSNTSTIPLRDLVATATAAFRRRFLVSHFFNPPR
ncbi:MAG: 3-hydroxyacyl-CoA dehydrogenase, partial [Rhizobiales bacterium]|nr:3-hydroxyacyl-CoA dehydrogenase [Hyphomicrobiales bacterium]